MSLPPMKQLPLAIAPESLPTFQTFLAGPNAAALAHLQALPAAAAPVTLWGPPGSGKTHLLRALVHQRQQAGQRVGWFTAADALPWSYADDWSLVVIDRADELDSDRQQAAFALFVEATTHGVPVVAASRLPPIDLPLRDDLRTRLAWGLVFALHNLSEPETRAVLRREADRRGIFLSDDVMNHLLTHFPRDLRHLMHVLDGLDDFALAKGRAVTVPLLRLMLAEEGLPELASP